MPSRRTHARHTRPRPDPGRLKRSVVLAVDFSPGFEDFIRSADPSARRPFANGVFGQGRYSTEAGPAANGSGLSTSNSGQGVSSGCVHESDG